MAFHSSVQAELQFISDITFINQDSCNAQPLPGSPSMMIIAALDRLCRLAVMKRNGCFLSCSQPVIYLFISASSTICMFPSVNVLNVRLHCSLFSISIKQKQYKVAETQLRRNKTNRSRHHRNLC